MFGKIGKRFSTVIIAAAALLTLACVAAYAQEQPPVQPPVQQQGTPEVTQPSGETAPPGHVYFYRDGEPAQVEREITGGGQMVEFAILELLKGPTEEEKAAGYVTYIPQGTKLQYTTIKQDRSEYSLNLSHELLQLAGDAEASIRAMTQIVKTVQDVSGIQNVGVTVAAESAGGQPQDAFEALGVSRAEITGSSGGGEQGGGGSSAGLVVGIVLGSLAALAILAAVILMARKRRTAERGRSAKKAGGTASAKSAGKKKGK